MFLRSLLLAHVGLRLAPISAADVRPKNYALLVAVTTYEHAEMNRPKLEFPEVDAAAVRDFLAARGYEVKTLFGPRATQTAIEDALNDFGAKSNESGALILGLWGHGVEDPVTREAFFCPYDTSIRLVKDSQGRVLKGNDGQTPLIEPDPASLVGMSRLLAAMRICGAGNRLLLADCCRSAPNQPRGRAFGASVKLSDLPDNTAAVFACSSNEQAFEHVNWRHGAMTKCLLELLPQLEGDAKDVAAITGALQTNVLALVQEQSRQRERQTVHPISNGVVRLRLSKPTGPGGQPIQIGMPARRPVLQAGDLHKVSLAEGVELSFRWVPLSPVKAAGQAGPGGIWMGETEITQAQWTAVLQEPQPYFSAAGDGRAKVRGEETETLPMENISWYDAASYCNAVSAALKRTPCYELSEVERLGGSITTARVEAIAGTGVRLPERAEWLAAIGESGPSEASLEAGEWHIENSDYRTHPVGMRQPNALHLCDLLGNVSEWSADLHPDQPGERLVLGRSFIHRRTDASLTARHAYAPWERDNATGLRLVLEPE